MFDSRQFLQFLVDRRLSFDFNRALEFSAGRQLMFNAERDLSFNMDRNLPFGMFGPVFRGRACKKCKMLVHPVEGVCRGCGTPLETPDRPVTKTKRRARPPETWPKEPQTMICPNCALVISQDSMVCPRCRVNIDEWRQYIQDLKKWEAKVQRAAVPGYPSRPPRQSSGGEWQDVRVRRRR